MKRYVDLVEDYLRYNNLNYDPKRFLISIVILSFAISVIATVVVSTIGAIYAFVAFAGIFFLVQAGMLGALYFKSKSRADRAEEYLPNLLELIATNIKSGMTPDKAMLYSLKGESGPFKEDIKKITKESVTVKPLEAAMREVPKSYNSDLIYNSFLLISKGVRGGGNLSSLLEKTAQDIREVRSLKKEALADVNLHALFLVFAAIVGAPLLFGTTSFLIDEIVWISQKTANIFFSGQSSGFFYFAITAVSLNAFFASILLGTIKEGRKREGLKYLPLFFAFAIGLLFVVRYVMQWIFFSISV